MKLKDRFLRRVYNIAGNVYNSLSQQTGEADTDDDSAQIAGDMPGLIRAAAAEGAVLLKNNGVLPFKKEDTVSVFGRAQIETFFVGYGSGGDVKAPYKINCLEGMKNCDSLTVNAELAAIYEEWCKKNPADEGVWGRWPRYFPEMPVDEKTVTAAAEQGDSAVVIIGRSSGEDRENALEQGSYYLTDEEKELLTRVTRLFARVAVVLNIGSVIDMSWLEEFGDRIGAVLVVWQGGMETGNALADLLCGAVSPSGRLTDTVAASYSDYPCAENFGARKFNNYVEDVFVGYRYFSTFAPEKVLFPFGFGLSYADFETKTTNVCAENGTVKINVTVTNISDTFSGKQVVQVYCQPPEGALAKPVRNLVAFAKTDNLAVGESQQLELSFQVSAMAPYDDFGATGHKSAYVLEKGSYRIFVGDNVRDAAKVYEYICEETTVTQQLSEVSAPVVEFNRIAGIEQRDGRNVPVLAPVPLKTTNLKKIIEDNLPPKIRQTEDRGYKLQAVANGYVSIDDFVAQLSLEELEAVSRGDYTMDSPLGAKGNAGAMGGVTGSLRLKGIKPIITTDGPSGIRLSACCSLLPIGTLLACSWNLGLVKELYAGVGREMRERGSDVLLAPGLNIHRSPLCGRNFEYFSEDPLVSGKLACAVVSGVESAGVGSCPKHFACNNQETNRNYNDSRLSERALREIYLKGFEIVVKEANPKCIMTSYNKINGVWGHYNYELCTTVLRGEWGFKGLVMTDWWMRKSKSPEFPLLCDNAYRVRAQVDVLMPGGDRGGKRVPDGTLLKSYGRIGGITIGEMQRTAKNVLGFLIAEKKEGTDS